MKLPKQTTKIVCTIGPASRGVDMLERLIRAGMNVARLNLAHGDFDYHRENIRAVRRAAARVGEPVAIMIDLPGPKIRIGKLLREPLALQKDSMVTLVPEGSATAEDQIPYEYKKLPRYVSAGQLIYLNDGFIQLKVLRVRRQEIHCRVVVGGVLLSHKGLNLPGLRTPFPAVTVNDLEILEFGLEENVDAFGLSFVDNANDVYKIKEVAARRGKSPFVVAKIEREAAVTNSDEILDAADALMIARGDLGVEIPLERVPIVQKTLIRKANLAGKPVITATQMLESMTDNVRPTRAEVTDVANAILDGTDAIMLSEETAIGKYPVEAVKMMASVAAATEALRPVLGSAWNVRERWKEEYLWKKGTVKDTITLHVAETLSTLNVRYIVTPTLSGDTARRVSRFKPQTWILAFTEDKQVRNSLVFSASVYPFLMSSLGRNRDEKILRFLKRQKLTRAGDQILLTERATVGRSDGTNSLKIVEVE